MTQDPITQSCEKLLEQPHGTRIRDSLLMIRRAVENGWEIPDDWTKTLPKVMAQIVADPQRSDRVKISAMKVLVSMQGKNVDAALALDKIERLDGGEPTERTDHTFAERPTDEDLQRWREEHTGGD